MGIPINTYMHCQKKSFDDALEVVCIWITRMTPVLVKWDLVLQGRFFCFSPHINTQFFTCKSLSEVGSRANRRSYSTGMTCSIWTHPRTSGENPDWMLIESGKFTRPFHENMPCWFPIDWWQAVRALSGQGKPKPPALRIYVFAIIVFRYFILGQHFLFSARLV